MVIERTADDARFARDVAAGTGYVPDALLVVPIIDDDGDVTGVLLVLDRTATSGSVDALTVAAAFADLAALLLTAAADHEVGTATTM